MHHGQNVGLVLHPSRDGAERTMAQYRHRVTPTPVILYLGVDDPYASSELTS